MTADYVIKGLKQIIEEEAVANEGAGLFVPVYISQEDEIRDYPCIMIKDMGADEHDVLRGVFDPLTVEVCFCSIPNSDDGSGTTQDEHTESVESLYDILADKNTITKLNDFDKLNVFDIRGNEPINEREDGRNTASFSMEIVCCKDN